MDLAKKIAEVVREFGGSSYYVGGCVRDEIMGKVQTDIDMEIHGISPDILKVILNNLGKSFSVGKSFGVYSLVGYHLDIALPRNEYSNGNGHRDFEVYVDPNLGLYKAAQRRDFTMNSLMKNVLTGEIIDNFGGVNDIKAGIIRHVDNSKFSEDPLRVLRAAQFSARLLFEVADSTLTLCKFFDISCLPKERVESELKKALLFGQRPSLFFEILKKTYQLEIWFPEIKMLIGIEQDNKYHPEGDVWNHTMNSLDRAVLFRDKVSDPYSFMLLVLCHDFGKIITTKIINGRIHAYKHETEGLPVIRRFVSRLTSNKKVMKYVLNMSSLHMKPNKLAFAKSSVKSTNHLFDSAVAPEDLIYFSLCDSPVLAGDVPFTGDEEFLFDRYKQYKDIMAEPYVTGSDLIASGINPGVEFAEILAFTHKLRLAGIKKDNALKQALSMFRIR